MRDEADTTTTPIKPESAQRQVRRWSRKLSAMQRDDPQREEVLYETARRVASYAKADLLGGGGWSVWGVAELNQRGGDAEVIARAYEDAEPHGRISPEESLSRARATKQEIEERRERADTNLTPASARTRLELCNVRLHGLTWIGSAGVGMWEWHAEGLTTGRVERVRVTPTQAKRVADVSAVLLAGVGVGLDGIRQTDWPRIFAALARDAEHVEALTPEGHMLEAYVVRERPEGSDAHLDLGDDGEGVVAARVVSWARFHHRERITTAGVVAELRRRGWRPHGEGRDQHWTPPD